MYILHSFCSYNFVFLKRYALKCTARKPKAIYHIKRWYIYIYISTTGPIVSTTNFEIRKN